MSVGGRCFGIDNPTDDNQGSHAKEDIMMNANGKDIPMEAAVKLRLHQAHITCADTTLKTRLQPDLVDNEQCTIATRMVAGNQIGLMEELRAEIDHELFGLGFDRRAQIVSDLDLQAEKLTAELEQLPDHGATRRGHQAKGIGGSVEFFIFYIYPKAVLAAVREAHCESLAGEYQPQLVTILERVIAHMVDYSYGCDEDIVSIDSRKVPVEPIASRMRSEAKECVAKISQIRDLIRRDK